MLFVVIITNFVWEWIMVGTFILSVCHPIYRWNHYMLHFYNFIYFSNLCTHYLRWILFKYLVKLCKYSEWCQTINKCHINQIISHLYFLIFSDFYVPYMAHFYSEKHLLDNSISTNWTNTQIASCNLALVELHNPYYLTTFSFIMVYNMFIKHRVQFVKISLI